MYLAKLIRESENYIGLIFTLLVLLAIFKIQLRAINDCVRGPHIVLV